MTGSDLITRRTLIDAGLGHYAHDLVSLARPAIRLWPEPAVEWGLASGTSKFGGLPDLPARLRWPWFADQPLAFVAQINLKEMPRLPGRQMLPTAGLLSFFYDADQRAPGYDPASAKGWKVIWTPDEVPVVTHAPPRRLPDHGLFRTTRLRAQGELAFAPPWSIEVAQLHLNDDELFAYTEVLGRDSKRIHRMLGHPDPIQNDMQLECQLAANGVHCGKADAYRSPRAMELEKDATHWRLLLQIDSDEGAGLLWGDCGRIYYWMREGAIANGRWDEAWAILQCY